MRLIDADHFLNFIKEEMKQDRPDDMHLNNIIRVLKDLPTAYDVDKVVEELEEQAEQYRKRGFELEQKGYSAMADKYYGKYCSYEHAMEIVRKGGIDA